MKRGLYIAYWSKKWLPGIKLDFSVKEKAYFQVMTMDEIFLLKKFPMEDWFILANLLKQLLYLQKSWTSQKSSALENEKSVSLLITSANSSLHQEKMLCR